MDNLSHTVLFLRKYQAAYLLAWSRWSRWSRYVLNFFLFFYWSSQMRSNIAVIPANPDFFLLEPVENNHHLVIHTTALKTGSLIRTKPRKEKSRKLDW